MRLTFNSVAFLVESPFSDRDYNRFGIEILKKYFDVHVLNCTSWIKPKVLEHYSNLNRNCYEHIPIHEIETLLSVINELGVDLVIDYLGNSLECINVRGLLKRQSIVRCVTLHGILPRPRNASWLQKLARSVRDGDFLEKARTKFVRLTKELLIPDIVVLGGASGLNHPAGAADRKIWAHSFDYDIYLNLRDETDAGDEHYAVFLDEDMVHHSDYVHMNISAPTSEERYYSALNSFLNNFSSLTNMEVVIAAHPRSNYDIRPQLYGKRKVVKGRTAKLVSGAKLVFAHCSTSLSFAVLWNKPIILITSDDLINSIYHSMIQAFSNALKSPIVNIDRPNGFSMSYSSYFRHDRSAYSYYRNQFIKKDGTPDLQSWEIFSSCLASEGIGVNLSAATWTSNTAHH